MLLTGLAVQPVAAAPQRRHYIPWRFTVHVQPCFESQVIGSFDPQYVIVLCGGQYGWVSVSTRHGASWVYLCANKRFINRTMGLFYYIGASAHVGLVSPQVITILDQYGDWSLINTWMGQKWIYDNFAPPTAELDALLRRFGNSISVYFENLETGFIYRHNADRQFFSASVPKAFLALYVYQMAARGETCLDTPITFTNQDIWGGSGVIQHRYMVGTQLTQRYLLGLNLSHSDNIATLMLRRYHGLNNYRQFIANTGGNPAWVGDRIVNGRLTANEAGHFAREIFNFIESDSRYGQEFKYHLLNNHFPFIVSDYPVASKTGWTRYYAWHDMAIVYATSPYVLVILSARAGWTPQDYHDFEEISMAFQDFNARWFGG